MAKYQCHYFEDGQARSQLEIDAPDDATVLLEAEGLLVSSGFRTIEIWQVARLVGRVTIGTPEELTHGEAKRTHKPGK